MIRHQREKQEIVVGKKMKTALIIDRIMKSFSVSWRKGGPESPRKGSRHPLSEGIKSP
jgi:hypothetical protein